MLPAPVEPPAEFRLFAAGENPATDGHPALFDDEAARNVMAEYERMGRVLDINYGHDDSNPFLPSHLKESGGYFGLDVREGPELWAVNVQWTPDAVERIAARKLRYFSPRFSLDDSGRVSAVYNVALTNDPATYSLPPLVELQRMFQAIAYPVSPVLAEPVEVTAQTLYQTPGEATRTGEKKMEFLRSLMSALGLTGEPDEPAILAAVTRAVAHGERLSADLATATRALSEMPMPAAAPVARFKVGDRVMAGGAERVIAEDMGTAQCYRLDDQSVATEADLEPMTEDMSVRAADILKTFARVAPTSKMPEPERRALALQYVRGTVTLEAAFERLQTSAVPGPALDGLSRQNTRGQVPDGSGAAPTLRGGKWM